MKLILTTLLCLIVIGNLSSQNDLKCLSEDLIVVAENLNFRQGPDLNSDVIDELDNSERLKLIEVDTVFGGNYCFNVNNTWLKVKRKSSGQIGYVLGRYVKSENIAYLNGQDCERIQSGNWYGLYLNKSGKIGIEEVQPELKKVEGEGYQYITVDSTKYKFLICSQMKLTESQIEGKFFDYKSGLIKIGSKKKLLRIGQNQFELVCTGEVELLGAGLIRKNEKLLLHKIEIKGSQRKYSNQDLSKSILKFGEIGYQIEFVGDLNNDGLPELIISEGNTRSGTYYFFMSNSDGETIFQSMTWTSSKC